MKVVPIQPEPSSAEDTIRQLARTFPSLRGLVEQAWNPESLDEWAAGGASHGERLAVRFVLTVWNQHQQWKCGKFDVFDAWQTWDEEHWNAFRAWARQPFTL
jgi:hypothetical protein